eukprot:2922012-Prymnesium_polylepis.1
MGCRSRCSCAGGSTARRHTPRAPDNWPTTMPFEPMNAFAAVPSIASRAAISLMTRRAGHRR